MNTAKPYSSALPSKNILSAKNLAAVGMSAALLSIISQISLPMPTGVPITIQVFGIALIASVLGWKLGFISTVIYILIGAAGLPVFSNFSGGIGSLVGLTGGYIWSWPVMAVLCGVKPAFGNKKINFTLTIVSALCGLMLNELAGMVQWYFLSGQQSFQSIFLYSVTAFIPKDIVLTVFAVLIGGRVRLSLIKAGIENR